MPYASEAVEQLAGYLFADVRVHQIQATLHARNIPSQKLCKRIGMRRKAHFKQDYWSKGE
ncbi:GNAT family N-acetyltransferase [Halobacillus litoralis]|nr:GNAT family N-acetyltransferase [Halobacillus litoralis]